MYGEDSSGLRVSLLNDDTSTTNTIHHAKTTQARPAIRSREIWSTSSNSSVHSRDGGGGHKSSARSSISCSPLHSPPTPPSLVRLDSKSSVYTPSPMTPQYQFDPMDHHQQQSKYDASSSIPYYSTQFTQPMHQPGGIGGNSNPYPSFQDNISAQYYPMDGQYRLPPMYDMDEPCSHAQPNSLGRLQTSVPHYASNTILGSMSPLSTAHSSMMPSSASLHHTGHLPNGKPKVYDQTTNVPSSAPAAAFPVPTPIAIDPSNPLASSVSASSTKHAGISASSGACPLPKKKYPCPHAKEHNCQDTFTTSGHAARHGKKHTGEKNVHCPTCDKKFTRKDNMKQHERTHKSGSGSGSGRTASGHSSEHGVSKIGSRNKKRAMSSGTMSLTDGDSEQMDLDSADHMRTSTSTEKLQRPPMRGRTELSRILEQTTHGDAKTEPDADEEDADADGEGESPGLDALAHVAAGQMGI